MKRPAAWLWEWIPEGGEFAHPLMGVAWDERSWHHDNYRVLTVLLPFNFVVRAAYLLRYKLWRWSRFGSLHAWQRWRARCPHCGRNFLSSQQPHRENNLAFIDHAIRSAPYRFRGGR